MQIFLTSQGLIVADEIQKLYVEYLEECLVGFSQEEIQMLEKLLEKFGEIPSTYE